MPTDKLDLGVIIDNVRRGFLSEDEAIEIIRDDPALKETAFQGWFRQCVTGEQENIVDASEAHSIMTSDELIAFLKKKDNQT
jgi:hypothetical protein